MNNPPYVTIKYAIWHFMKILLFLFVLTKNHQKQKVTLHRKINIVCTKVLPVTKHNNTKQKEEKKKKKFPPAPNFPPPSPDK